MTYDPNKNSEEADFSSVETEWDSVKDEVEFKGTDTPDFNEQEKRSETLDFARENYGSKLEFFVEESCFEGGARDNLDNYVWSLALEGVISTDDQKELIKSYAFSDEINPEIIEKLSSGISEKIENSKLKAEISSDPYLRVRRANTLAGTPNSDIEHKLGDPDWELVDFLWRFDDEFYQSDEARSLLTNESYLERVYGVEERVEKEAELDTETPKEEIERKYVGKFSKILSSIVETNEASVEELIKDPYLRKRHFDDLSYENLDEKRKTTEQIRDLWWSDKEFYDSFEYQDLIREKREERPDIYDKVDMNAVFETTNERFEKISRKEFIEIIKAYEKGARVGDQRILQTLIPILGLSRNKPALTYEPAKESENGYYKKEYNLINICEENLAKNTDTEKPIMEDEAVSEQVIGSFFDRFRPRPKKLEYKLFERMGTVAHEAWHAHQWLGENVDKERRAKYRENFVYYLTNKRNGYDSYRDQLIEAEAFAFGNSFMARCTSIYFKERGGKYD